MRLRRYGHLFAALAALAVPARAQNTPVPLNDHERLGQQFTVARPLVSVAPSLPSWSDNEGGVTLTLWDSPARQQKLASLVAVDVIDNEYVELRPAQPLPPGTYYWEITERTGVTRIGLWMSKLAEPSDDCAWIDGVPQRDHRFVQRVDIGPPVRESVADLIRHLEDGTPEEIEAACRQLAIYGTDEAVPALARRLAEPATSHLARVALENLPGEAAAAALADALNTLRGETLIGVITSVAARRQTGAVGRLQELLAAEPAVAAAAARALGAIASPEAITALTAGLGAAAPASLWEGALVAAETLLTDGQKEAAAALFDRLATDPAPPVVLPAALLGQVIARGDDGLPHLLELLRSDGAERLRLALTLAQRALPGEAVSAALAAELPRLAEATRPLLLQALANRGGAAAWQAVLDTARSGPAELRRIAVGLLPRFDTAAIDALLALTADADAPVAEAARQALGELPRTDASRLAGRLLRDADPLLRELGIGLVRKLQRVAFVPALSLALRDPVPAVREAAAQALGELGNADAVIPLRDVLLEAVGTDAAARLEQALDKVLGRLGEPDLIAPQLLWGWAQRTADEQLALLDRLGIVGGGAALKQVVETARTAAGPLRDAAREVLADWPTADAADALLEFAGQAAGEARRQLVHAALRLSGLDGTAVDRRLAIVEAARPLLDGDADLRQLLAALGRIPSTRALAAVLPWLASPLRDDAATALLAIATPLAKGPEAAALRALLNQLIAAKPAAELVEQAKKLLESLPAP